VLLWMRRCVNNIQAPIQLSAAHCRRCFRSTSMSFHTWGTCCRISNSRLCLHMRCLTSFGSVNRSLRLFRYFFTQQFFTSMLLLCRP
jgi:hypothetical protein